MASSRAPTYTYLGTCSTHATLSPLRACLPTYLPRNPASQPSTTARSRASSTSTSAQRSRYARRHPAAPLAHTRHTHRAQRSALRRPDVRHGTAERARKLTVACVRACWSVLVPRLRGRRDRDGAVERRGPRRRRRWAARDGLGWDRVGMTLGGWVGAGGTPGGGLEWACWRRGQLRRLHGLTCKEKRQVIKMSVLVGLI